MTYETVVRELVTRFPELRHQVSQHIGAKEPQPYTALGSILIPRLEDALDFGDLSTIVRICAYLEDMAVDSRTDGMLGELLHVEIGEWLGWAAHEDRLTPWLGPETKRICRYVPGLATQRRRLKEENAQSSVKARLTRLFGKP